MIPTTRTSGARKAIMRATASSDAVSVSIKKVLDTPDRIAGQLFPVIFSQNFWWAEQDLDHDERDLESRPEEIEDGENAVLLFGLAKNLVRKRDVKSSRNMQVIPFNSRVAQWHDRRIADKSIRDRVLPS